MKYKYFRCSVPGCSKIWRVYSSRFPSLLWMLHVSNNHLYDEETAGPIELDRPMCLMEIQRVRATDRLA